MKRKVLVTGAAGFLGTRAVAKLAQDYDVYTLARSTDARLPGAIKVLLCDLKDKETLVTLEPLKEMETIVHLASHVPEGFSTTDDLGTLLANNLTGTRNLLDCLSSLKYVCLASTIEVYGRPERVPVREGDSCRPITPYGLSKLFQEIYTDYYCTQNEVALTILRFATIYGQGEKYARAIPNFIKAVLSDRPVQIAGEGNVMRDYVYIDDAVEGIEAALRKRKEGRFNVTGGHPISMKELARLVADLCGKKLKVERRPSGPNSFDNYLSPRNAAKALGFVAKTPLKEGLKREIEYFRHTT
ncbi:NAD(P)-dependent oxidoreductase [Nitrososphaera sp.]|uniref:NAD-dependent epimerase/dehydratase family protein n=1 Tax=Nitrososphaera sp. TaxID=1971748 RepID=UPI003173E9EF